MNYHPQRRGSRTLERSLSYSEAIGNRADTPPIEIPTLDNTDVYFNEELKKQYRISQTYVEGKEISFPPILTNIDTNDPVPSSGDGLQTDSQYSSEDEQTGCIMMTIDVEPDSPKTSESTRHYSNATTQPVNSFQSPSDFYDKIERDIGNDNDMYSTIGTTDTTGPSAYTYSAPYTKRSKKGTRHRRKRGRPVRSRRVVHKNGDENVPVRSNIPAKSIKYMRDIVNTVINSKWRFLLLMMVLLHFVFWFTFAGIWYAVANSYQEDIGDGKEHCVTGTSSFAGLLMMSVETQMTIGYGVRFPNEECPEAIIVMVLEIVAGTALSGGLVSLLYTKLVRPNRHVSSVGFSKKATVCLRDGELCLQFRVWDLLNLHIISSSITAYILKPIRTLEGELVHNYIHQLKLKNATAFLLWPITVVHVIDADSPLYEFSAEDMMDYRFEIVVCLTGSSKNMGTVTQSRTSYLSKEIIWGYRFKNVLTYSKKKESYIINVDELDTVEQVPTPLCSASRLKCFEEDIKSSDQVVSTPTYLSPSPTYMSPSPTYMSPTPTELYNEDSSQPTESIPSTPSFSRNGTQRSFGWNFKKYPTTVVQGNDVTSHF
ncbi:G protein-activated inward rectifier potassium channel 3-like [Ostrinia furnacalis]|uniref:G protein-activated inward rectifier potassium channel 3-like n=1 Tax=Ostrinia furnacalis TaxID=93504 RepID=UPI00103B93D5|nr:G protein-activated inward rectifier potassium channel 3-like [Ostrinia furnacalis]